MIGSGISIALLITQRYAKSLKQAMSAQAENVAHAVALEAVEKVLINDRVALQKMLDYQIRSHPSISYAFVTRDGDILAHTFEKGVPAALLTVNDPQEREEFAIKRIASTTGQTYLDIAWPIFEGRAGVLRMGFSEKPYHKQITSLWVQIGLVTLTIVAIAVISAFFFIRRIINPLSELTTAIKRVDMGEKGVRIGEPRTIELSTLSRSFNHMMGRIENYTAKLEEKTGELERTHSQARIFCSIVREIGSLKDLDDLGLHLVRRLGAVLKCARVGLLLTDRNSSQFFLDIRGQSKVLEGPPSQICYEVLGDGNEPRKIETASLPEAFLPKELADGSKVNVIPVPNEGKPIGALISSCTRKCRCTDQDIRMGSMILKEASSVLGRALAHHKEMLEFRKKLEEKREFSGIIGKDPKMQVIYKLIEDVAPTDATVLIQGESGTGKELVAQAIHERSSRRGKPFIVINCSAYPETLIESELFGHEKGAFTGAVKRKIGRFEQANGGTVFLDEVAEMPPSAQIKLLRVLQTHKFERVGGERTLKVDVRVISATNKDLLEKVKEGAFREDLYYRLNVIPIHMPPLRERRNDIPLLVKHFIRASLSSQSHKKVMEVDPEAMRLLMNYDWPGNVRELENTIEHAVLLAKDEIIHPADLPRFLFEQVSVHERDSVDHVTLEEHEKIFLGQVLEECGWNKKKAAERLGISRNTLYAKLKRYGISRPTTH